MAKERKRSRSEMKKERQKLNIKNVMPLKKKYKKTMKDLDNSEKNLNAAVITHAKSKKAAKEAEKEYKQAKPIGPNKYGKRDIIYLKILENDIRDKLIKKYLADYTLTYKGRDLFQMIFKQSDLRFYFGGTIPIYLSYDIIEDGFWIGICNDDDETKWKFMPLSIDDDGYATFHNVLIGKRLKQLCNQRAWRMEDAMRQKNYYDAFRNSFWIICNPLNY